MRGRESDVSDMELLTERYAGKIKGVISGYDRIIIQGNLPGICYADGMTAHLYYNGIRIFDFRHYASRLRERIRDNAHRIADAAGLEIEHIRKKNFRKEAKIKEIIRRRGEHPGLVHVFSALESCRKYRPWYDKKQKRALLLEGSGKCIHYYFYFIDEFLGLCYVRVPTWLPFRLQIYFNGHNLLANRLRQRGIDYRLIDNAFVDIGDFQKAQKLCSSLPVVQIHKTLNRFARRFCPVAREFKYDYYWSIMQAEYATDIVFKRQKDLQELYEHISRTAIHAVKPRNIATFLGRKLNGNYRDEVGNDFNTRIEGTRIRHVMGKSAIKMYDKLGMILRIETTTNDVSFFKHYRKVEHRDGTSTVKFAPMKKTIYNLKVLRKTCAASNRRYLEFISAIEDRKLKTNELRKISAPVVNNNRKYRGFNFFDSDDLRILIAVSSGEFNLNGFRNRTLREKLPGFSTGQISRILKRMRLHGLIKKVPNSYKYYITSRGKRAILSGLKLRETVILPGLAAAA